MRVSATVSSGWANTRVGASAVWPLSPGAERFGTTCGSSRADWARAFVGGGRERPADGRSVNHGAGGAAELAGRRIALGRILGQRARNDRVEARRNTGSVRGARRVVVEVGQDRGRRGRAREGRPAGQAAVQQAADRVDIAARGRPLATQMLGRHEVDRAQPLAGVGDARPRVRTGDTEVAQVNVVPGQENVGGLDVAMDEPGRMGGVERGGDLLDQSRRALG